MTENHSDCDHEIGTCQIYGYYRCPHDSIPAMCMACLDEFIDFEDTVDGWQGYSAD